MGRIIFLNTGYKPTEAEKVHFWYLQAATRNAIREIIQNEPSRYWQQARIQSMVKRRREKFELIKNEELQEQ